MNTELSFHERDTLRYVPAALHPDHAATLLRIVAAIRDDGHCRASRIATTWQAVAAIVELRSRGLVVLARTPVTTHTIYDVEVTAEGFDLADAYLRFEPETAS